MWLQTKKIITAAELAAKFSVSIRTIYRDIKALEQAGIPVVTQDGLGYSLMEGYRIPPVMFTESEANALITAEALISGNRDGSFVKEFKAAAAKVKAVFRQSIKEKAGLLQERTIIRQHDTNEISSNHLSALQLSVTNSQLVKINYTDDAGNSTERIIEPFAFYGTRENWLLIAYCRLRNGFRAFRLDRMLMVLVLNEKFTPQKMTLREFFNKYYTTPDT